MWSKKPWLALLRLSLFIWCAPLVQSWKMILPFRNCFCPYSRWSTCRYSGRRIHSGPSLRRFMWLAIPRPQLYIASKKKVAHSWFSQAALTVVMFASTCLEVSKLNIPPWTASSTAEVQPKNCPTDWGETPALLKHLVTLKGRGFPFLLFTVTLNAGL